MEPYTTDAKTPPGPGRTSVRTVLDILSIIFRHRKFLVRFVVLVTATVTVVALLLPKWYKSTASVFPAEKADLFGGLEGVSSLVKNFTSPARALSSLTGNSETDRYIAILKSNTVIAAVINKFDLVNVYDITSYPGEKTAKELLSNTDFSVEVEGNLNVTVYDKDPQRAADMANYFVEVLNKTNSELQVQNARATRAFIEERYKKNLQDLANAEDSLKAFQQRYGVIAMPEQTTASIKAGAEIAALIALKQVHAGVLKRTQSVDNPDVVAAQIEIDELHRKLIDMNTGGGVGKGEMKVLVPFSKIPELGAEYIRRFRDVEIQYKILQFITPLFEQAKVEERRQTPSVVVLDRAAPAERKAKPRIALFALIAFVGSTIVAAFIIFFLEFLGRLKAADRDRLEGWGRALRDDWFGLRMTRERK